MDATSGEIGNNGSNSNNVEEGWTLQVIGPFQQGRAPMNSAIARTMVWSVTHVTMDAFILYFRGSVLEVAIVH